MFEKIKALLFRNTDARQTVAKNTFWISVSQFGGRFIRAIIIIYATRVLGAAGWGEFSYAVTLVAFFTLFADFGLNNILVREAAKAESEEGKIAATATASLLKAFLLALAFLTVVFVMPFFTTLPGVKPLLPVVAFILIFDTIREFGFSLLRGLERMEWEAAIFLFTNIAIVGFGILFLNLSATPLYFSFGYVVGTAIGAAAAMYLLRKYFMHPFAHASWKLAKELLRTAWPFAIVGALGMLTTNTDVLIIGLMRSAEDVGYYSAAIRIIQLLYLIPTVLQISFLPQLSRLAAGDRAKFRSVLERAISLIYLFSVPLALGGFITGSAIIIFLFGPQFAPGSWAFRILMLTMMIDFPAIILSGAIFAYDHQKSLIVASAIGGISNVIFDLLFIPSFGITGSAVATFCAQLLSNAYLWHVMRKINYFEIMPRLKKIAISGIAMTAVTIPLFLARIHIVIIATIVATVYFALLYLLKEPLVDEVKLILAPARRAPAGES